MLLVSLFIWFSCALVCEAIATSKGRSGLLWAVSGLLFGPFAVVLVAVLPKDQDAIDWRDISRGKKRKCPYCAEVVNREAVICKHCHTELGALIDDRSMPSRFLDWFLRI